MTGWRIGFAVGPAEIISAMSKVQSHTTSSTACSISQKASVEALSGPQAGVNRMVAEFQRRRNYVLMKLQQMAGISCFKPQGAFLCLPECQVVIRERGWRDTDQEFLRAGLLPSERSENSHCARRCFPERMITSGSLMPLRWRISKKGWREWRSGRKAEDRQERLRRFICRIMSRRSENRCRWRGWWAN